MSVSITDLLKTLTLEQLNELKEKLGFNLKATTRKELVPSLSRAIKRANVHSSVLIKEVDKIRHPTHQQKHRKRMEKKKTPAEIRKVIKILHQAARSAKTISDEEELHGLVKASLTVKGYAKVLTEKGNTKPVMILDKACFPDFRIPDERMGDIAIELKVLKDRGVLLTAFGQVRAYRKAYKHVILFIYDAGQRDKPNMPTVVVNGSIKKEIEKMKKGSIYVEVEWNSDLEKKLLKKIQRSEKLQGKIPRVAIQERRQGKF